MIARPATILVAALGIAAVAATGCDRHPVMRSEFKPTNADASPPAEGQPR